MSVLQDFYNGYTPPKKDFGDNTFSGYLALKESAEQREKELLISLSEEQIRLYKRIHNDRSDMTGLDLNWSVCLSTLLRWAWSLLRNLIQTQSSKGR